MAKKVVIPPKDGETSEDGVRFKKKKRNKCCTCLIILTVFNLVLLTAAFCVAWILGDKYSKRFFDMPLSDTLGVVGDLYWADGKDVLDNPYDPDADLKGFYAEIERNIFLKEGSLKDMDVNLKKALDKMIGGENKADAKNSDGSDDGEDVGSSAVADLIFDMIGDAFKSENIDRVELEKYTPENDTYIFKIKDKQLAAFANSILTYMLEGDIIEGLSSINEMVPLKNVAKLKQIKYEVQTVNDGETEFKATAAKLTVWVGAQDIASGMVKKMLDDNGYGWASGFVGWLCDVFLPENVYVHATIPLEDGAKPDVYFNTQNEAQRARMYKLINGVFKNIMGSDTTVESLMDDIAGNMRESLGTIASYFDFKEAAQGSISVDLIGSMANMVSESMELSDPIKKEELMYTLQMLLTSDAKKRMVELEPFLYKEWYVSDDISVPAKYKYDNTVDTTGMTRVDYEKKFVQEIEATYGLEFGPDSSLKDVLSIMGISIDGSSPAPDSMLDSVSPAKLKALVDDNNPPQKLLVTDRMLAAAISGDVDKIITDLGGDVQKLGMEFVALSFVSKQDSDHTFALVAFSINIKNMLPETLDFISGAIPDRIMISMAVDITLSLPAGGTYEKTEIMINDYDKSMLVFDTMGKLVNGLNLNAAVDDIGSKLREMVLQLDETLHIDLVTYDDAINPVTPGTIVLPDVFTVITDKVLLDGEGNAIMTGAELKAALRGMQDVSGLPETADIADDYSGFLDDVVDKYYLAPTAPINTFDDLTDFLTDGEEGFSADKFRVTGTEAGVKYMAHDRRSTVGGALDPIMTPREVGALIRDKKDSNEELQKFEVMKVETGDDLLIITLAVDVDELMPENDATKLLSLDKMYIVAAVDMSHTIGTGEDEAYPVEVKINNMADEGAGSPYANTMKLVRHYAGDFDIDEQVGQIGRVVFTTMNDLNSSMANSSDPDRCSFIKFRTAGLTMTNFFGFLANKMDITEDANGDPVSDETVKAAVQGMYEAPTAIGVEASDYNYDLSNVIINRGTAATLGTMPALPCIDKEFNGYVQHIITSHGDLNVDAQQTIALAKDSYTAGSAEKHIKDRLNNRIAKPGETAPLVNDDYIVVTFQMPLGQFSNGEKPEAEGFIPDVIYATIALEKNAEGRLECAGMVFNDMDAVTYALLVKMMGMTTETAEPGKVNIKSVTNDCLDGLNTLMFPDEHHPDNKMSDIVTMSLGTVAADLGDPMTAGVGKINIVPVI